MKTIIDYKVIVGTDDQEFSDKINRLIKEGWQPLGEVILSDSVLAQAVVKYEPFYLPIW
jgi:hypothetical protein